MYKIVVSFTLDFFVQPKKYKNERPHVFIPESTGNFFAHPSFGREGIASTCVFVSV